MLSIAPGRLLLSVALLVWLLGVIPGRVAYAAENYVVTNTADADDGSCATGNCTLRDAIKAANTHAGADTITFSVSGIITLSATLPAIDDEVTIDGTGHGITVSGNSAVRVMIVNAGKWLNLRSITIANGFSPNNGGAIYNSGTLAVIGSTFTGNAASASYGGSIYNDTGGMLTVTSSTFDGNNAIWGGGITNNGMATMTVTSSAFSGNSAFYGGGIWNNGMATMTVTNSILSANSAHVSGGIDNAGTLSMTNSTLTDNVSSFSESSGGGMCNSRTLTVINSTFAENSAASGGGGIYNSGTLTLTNSIIANSTSGGDCVNIGAVTGSHNLIKDADQACGLTNGDHGNLIGVDPRLGPLALNGNGGSTLTYLPLAGSPAINNGDNTPDQVGGCPTVDQRGVARPQGGACDIGAVESLIWPRALFLQITVGMAGRAGLR
jgi:CSLREA domain-containing protein